MVVKDVLQWAKENKYQTLVIALSGDLGAGKTTFTQELAKHLKVNDIVTSPTFTIMKRYQTHHSQFFNLVHIDAYRFETEAEAEPLRLPEVFLEPKTIVVVEWPERITSIMDKDWPKEASDALPQGLVRILISVDDNETRQVEASYEPAN